MTIMTKECHQKLMAQLQKYKFEDLPKASEYIDECRSMGSLDDNPEYFNAIEELDRLNKKIDELNMILNNSTIFSISNIDENKVGFGATVEFINYETNDKKEYTLVSVYDSDISKGFISVDAPFAKEMIGLSCGDFFSFRGNDYEITNIHYSFVK